MARSKLRDMLKTFVDTINVQLSAKCQNIEPHLTSTYSCTNLELGWNRWKLYLCPQLQVILGMEVGHFSDATSFTMVRYVVVTRADFNRTGGIDDASLVLCSPLACVSMILPGRLLHDSPAHETLGLVD